jgi:hypothetical protein
VFLRAFAPSKGLPAFSFIDQGKEPGYTREREGERKRKRRKRKTREKRPRSYVVLLLRQAGPAGGVDDGGDGFMSRGRRRWR